MSFREDGTNLSTSSQPTENFPGFAVNNSRTTSPNPFRQHNTSIGGGSSGYNDHHTKTTRQRVMANDFQKDTTPATKRDFEVLKHDIEKLKNDFRELERKNKFISPELVDTTWRELLNLRAFVGYTTSSSSPWKTWSSYHQQYLQNDGEQVRSGTRGGLTGSAPQLLLRGSSTSEGQTNALLEDRSRSAGGSAFDIGSSSDNASPISPVYGTRGATHRNGEAGAAAESISKLTNDDPSALSPLNADDLPPFTVGTPKTLSANAASIASGNHQPMAVGGGGTLTPEVLRSIIAFEVSEAMKHREGQMEQRVKHIISSEKVSLTSAQRATAGCYNTRNGSHCCERNAEVHLEANRRLRIYLDEANRRNALHHELQRKCLSTMAAEQSRLVTLYDSHLAKLHRTSNEGNVPYKAYQSHNGGGFRSATAGGHVDPHLMDDRSHLTASLSPEHNNKSLAQKNKYRNEMQQGGYESPPDESDLEDDENVARVRRVLKSGQVVSVTTTSSITNISRTHSNANLNIFSSPPNNASGDRAPVMSASGVVSDRFREKAEAIVTIIKEDPYLLDMLSTAVLDQGAFLRKLRSDLVAAKKPIPNFLLNNPTMAEGTEISSGGNPHISTTASSTANWIKLLEETAATHADSAVVQAVEHFNGIVEGKIAPRLNEMANNKFKELNAIVAKALRDVEEQTAATSSNITAQKQLINSIVAQAISEHISEIKIIAEESVSHMNKKIEDYRASIYGVREDITKTAETIRSELVTFGEAEKQKQKDDANELWKAVAGQLDSAATTPSHASFQSLAILLPIQMEEKIVASPSKSKTKNTKSKDPVLRLLEHITKSNKSQASVADFIFLRPLTNTEVSSFAKASSFITAEEGEGYLLLRRIAQLAKKTRKMVDKGVGGNIIEVFSGNPRTLGLLTGGSKGTVVVDNSDSSDDDNPGGHKLAEQPWLSGCSGTALRELIIESSVMLRGANTPTESFEVLLSWQQLLLVAQSIAERTARKASAGDISRRGDSAEVLHWQKYGHPILSAIRIYWHLSDLLVHLAPAQILQPIRSHNNNGVPSVAGLVDEVDMEDYADASPQAQRPAQQMLVGLQSRPPTIDRGSKGQKRGASMTSSRQSSQTSSIHPNYTLKPSAHTLSTAAGKGYSQALQRENHTRPLAEAITQLATALENGNQRRIEAAVEEEASSLNSQQRFLEEEVRQLLLQQEEQKRYQTGGGAREAAQLFSSPLLAAQHQRSQYLGGDGGIFHRKPSNTPSIQEEGYTASRTAVPNDFYGSKGPYMHNSNHQLDSQNNNEPTGTARPVAVSEMTAAEIADELQYRVEMKRKVAQQLQQQQQDELAQTNPIMSEQTKRSVNEGIAAGESTYSRTASATHSAQQPHQPGPRKVTVYHHHHSYISADDSTAAKADHTSGAAQATPHQQIANSKHRSPSASQIHTAGTAPNTAAEEQIIVTNYPYPFVVPSNPQLRNARLLAKSSTTSTTVTRYSSSNKGANAAVSGYASAMRR